MSTTRLLHTPHPSGYHVIVKESPAIGMNRNSKESKEEAPHYEPEENVLQALHHAVALKSSGEQAPETAILHERVDHCSCAPLLWKYVNGEIPSLERMFLTLSPLAEKIVSELGKESGDTQEEKKVASILAGREKAVRDCISAYVHSVMRFQQLQDASLLGSRDIKELFVAADKARRRAHDALIATLKMYTRTLQEAVSIGLIAQKEFAEWSFGEDARTIAPEKAAIFSLSTLDNREFIREWAVVADFQVQLKILEGT